MSGLKLTRISVDDVASVKGLHVTKDQQRFVFSPRRVLEIIKELGLEETSLPYIITVEGKPVGFFTLNFYSLAVNYYLENKRECSLQSFMIDREHQRRGYAKEAMRKFIKLIKLERQEIELIKLTVNLHNIAAKSLYMKCGFNDTGEVYLDGPSGPQHIYKRAI